ncbi:MAG: desulfoferrodoxin family protein [Bacteroidales bacterium]
MKQKFSIISLLTLIFVVALSFNSLANKTSVEITAPEKAAKGSEITIKIDVSHFGNSRGHHTDWVVVKINGEEYKKWEYNKDKLPEDSNFTLEFTVIAEEDMEIVAEGNCNKHGSKGKAKAKIVVQ